MVNEGKPAEEGSGRDHTTGAGATPASHVARSGSPHVPAQRFDAPDRQHNEAGGPAIVGIRATGEPDETPGEE